jgi:hypothetical protein
MSLGAEGPSRPSGAVARRMTTHEEVSTAPMIARGLSLHRVGSGLLMALLVTAWIGVPSVGAIEPPPAGPLDRPLADLALIETDAGELAPPLLLTLDTMDVPRGTVRIALLDRSIDWQPIASGTAVMADPGDGSETPWMVDLGSGEFVIVVTSHEHDQTSLLKVRVAPDGNPPIELGRPISLAIAVDDAGAIDVDGDGAIELVVASATTSRGGGTCQSSEVRVLEGSSLTQRAQFAVPDVRLAGGVLGEWDGQPGGDLLAYTFANCPAGPDSAERLGLLTLSLVDGQPTVAIAPGDPSGLLPLPGVPLGADLDGDGRQEAIIRDGENLAIFEPGRGTRTIAQGNVLPLAALSAGRAGQPGVVVWLEHSGDNDLSIAIGRAERSGDGSLALTTETLDLGDVAASRRSQVIRALADAAIAQAPSQAWVGDIDGDGCAEILGPLLIAQCVGGAEQTMRPGAAWFATRPITIFDARNGRELLIAATMAWHPDEGAPRAATPAASRDPGAWRHGPSVEFALAEIRASDAVYFGTFPVPRPTIERGPVQAPATDLPGFTGVRVVIRAVALAVNGEPSRDAPGLDAFLHDPVGANELVGVGRIPVPAGAESGRDGSFLRLPLGDAETPDGLPAERWIVTIAQINDWGEVAGPTRQTIELDSDGPSLVVETPFLSAPWPFEATIHGRSEPAIEIHGGTGGPVRSDRRGRFELRTQLAPWPQTVELIAVDETGNRTTKRFTLVGGVDYRAFPWAAIVAVALLLGAILSAGRGSGAARELEELPESDPLPEIEELPTAGEWPRA